MCLVLIKLCPLLADTYSYNATELALKSCAFMVGLAGPQKTLIRCFDRGFCGQPTGTESEEFITGYAIARCWALDGEEYGWLTGEDEAGGYTAGAIDKKPPFGSRTDTPYTGESFRMEKVARFC